MTEQKPKSDRTRIETYENLSAEAAARMIMDTVNDVTVQNATSQFDEMTGTYTVTIVRSVLDE